MPKLTTLARAVRLAVRAKAETLAAHATEELLIQRPLIMQTLSFVKLGVESHAKTLLHECHPVRLVSYMAKAVQLRMQVKTDFEVLDLSRNGMIGEAMIGETILG